MNTAAIGTASMDSPAAADTALLQLIWLASPALPVGGFSYSEGLEPAVEAGLVRDEASARDWLADQLHVALARGDLAVVAQAVQAARTGDEGRLRELDDWVRQTRETSELRQQTQQMGRSMGEWQRSLAGPGFVGRGDAATPAIGERSGAGVPFGRCQPADTGSAGRAKDEWTYPVAFAFAGAATDASPRQVALAFAFGWAENMVQAAVKAVPLGQGAGQRVLARLAGAIPAAVEGALALGDAGRQAFAPMLAILSSQHETQYSRLFRS